MRRILEGLRGFHQEHGDRVRPLLAHLAENGQAPHAMMITCADSRVQPELLTQTGPGELFVLRNIGALVPDPENEPSVGAGVDFAVHALGIRDLIVMGHSQCGAMKALLAPELPEGALGSWLAHGRPSRGRLDGNELLDPSLPPAERLSQLNVLTGVESLARYSAVRSRPAGDEVRLHAWWFDIASAEVREFDPARGRFEPLVPTS